MISAGVSVKHLARFVNGSPFKPEDLGQGGGYPVIRIRQLLDEAAEVDSATPPARAVWLQDGDLVFSWSATLAVRVWNRGPALLNQHLYRVDPEPGIRKDWLRYVLEVGVDRLKPLMHGSAMTHITQEMLWSVTTAVPSEADQERIANFLNVETARIDETIIKKRRLIELGLEHLDRRRNDVCWSGIVETAPLMHLTDRFRPIMYGIVLPGPHVDDGVMIVKGGDVAAGFGRPLCRTTVEIEASYARSRLRSGDLVFAIRGGVGDVEIVPSSADGANITQDVARIAPARGVSPQWLLHVLRSSAFQQAARSRVTGATITGLNIWDLKRLQVPDLPSKDQMKRSFELDAVEGRLREVNDRLGRQIALLQEHRQALITAAVTGQLDVSRAVA